MKKYFKWLLPIFVVSLIGSAVTLPNVDSHGYWLGISKGDIRALEAAVYLFREDHQRLPSAAEGLSSLVNTARKENDSGRERYLDRLPKDHWGNDYVYRITEGEKKFEIYSTGPDAIDNEGMGDDVVLGDKHYNCELYHDCLTTKDYLNRVAILTMLISLTLMLLLMLYKISAYVMGKIKDNNAINSTR